MYQLADKNKVMSLFHKGQSVSQIRLKSNVSKSTLYRWKAEYDMTGKIIGYVMKGKIDEAKQAISQFQEEHKNSNVLLTSKVINQLINFKYLDFAKELAEEALKQNPNNIVIISQLNRIVIEKGDLEEAERLCKEILAIEPNDLPARSQLVTIAKQKGNWEEVERLCEEILAIEPSDEIAKKQLKTASKMQKEKQKTEEEKRQNEEDQGVEKPQREEKQNTQQNVQIIRKQIQAGIFSLEDIEAKQKEMQEMGIDEVQRNILIAEAYEHQNLPKQTKAYLKKALQVTQEPELKKAIKALLEIAQTKKKKPSHINPWNIATSITSANKVGQTGRSPKELDEK